MSVTLSTPLSLAAMSAHMASKNAYCSASLQAEANADALEDEAMASSKQ